MRTISYILTTVALLICSLRVAAQTPDDAATCAAADTTAYVQSRPVTGMYALGLGAISSRVDYLSPLRFSGAALTLQGSWSKVLPCNPRHLRIIFDADMRMHSSVNAAGTAAMSGASGAVDFSMLWYTSLPYRLQVGVGGGIGFRGGAFMLSRNSNNPIDAQAMQRIAADAYVAWPVRLGRVNMLLTERCRVPLAGTFFTPEYGESYYEIYLGNQDNLCHRGWIGNMAGVDNTLGVSFDFGRTALFVGWRYDLYTTYANHLYTNINTNSIVIGVIPGGLGLKRQRPVCPTEIIR